MSVCFGIISSEMLTRSVQASMLVSELFTFSYSAKPIPAIPYLNKRSKIGNSCTKNRWMFPGLRSVSIESLSVQPPALHPPIVPEPAPEPAPQPAPEPEPAPGPEPVILRFNNMVRDTTSLSPPPSPKKEVKRCKKQLPDEPIYDSMISLAKTVFDQYGTGYTERVYQEGMYFSAYKKNIACLMERNVYVTHDSTPLFIGKVDLEVAGRFVFELKIHAFNEPNLKKDRLQIEKYLRAYAMNHHVIDRAALIYFTPYGVRVVEVEPFWLIDNEK
jgi:hypothetical protein